MVAPVLPWLTDSAEQLDFLFGELAEAGATGVRDTGAPSATRSQEWFMTWLAGERPDLVARCNPSTPTAPTPPPATKTPSKPRSAPTKQTRLRPKLRHRHGPHGPSRLHLFPHPRPPPPQPSTSPPPPAPIPTPPRPQPANPLLTPRGRPTSRVSPPSAPPACSPACCSRMFAMPAFLTFHDACSFPRAPTTFRRSGRPLFPRLPDRGFLAHLAPAGFLPSLSNAGFHARPRRPSFPRVRLLAVLACPRCLLHPPRPRCPRFPRLRAAHSSRGSPTKASGRTSLAGSLPRSVVRPPAVPACSRCLLHPRPRRRLVRRALVGCSRACCLSVGGELFVVG